MSDSNAIDQRRSKITDLTLTAALILAIGAAAFLRFPGLDLRPMHGDEGVNAMKFIHLAEGDGYRYDPEEFHGPLLPYLTVPWGVFNPDGDRADYTAVFFRSLIAVLGTLLVMTKLGVRHMFGRGAALYAAILIAISPAMSFYSRYYIHEMPLVLASFLVIVTAWYYLQNRRVGWAIACGACVGLMHATKETCVIAWFSMGVAAIAAYLVTRSSREDDRLPIRISHIVYALLAAVAVSVTFFTSLFTNWQGPWDSIHTYATWISAGAGKELRHEHPWYWYLQLLTWYHPKAGPWWSEALIVVLWVIGSVLSLGGWGFAGEARRFRGPAVFMTVYAFVLLAVYSVIPYKTPWIVLGPMHAMIIVGGIGAAVIVRKTPTVWAKAIVILALAAAAGQLADKAYQTNFRFYADARSPWVYAHPTRDVFRIAERAQQIAEVSGQGDQMVIRVIDDGNYWPLPYYLRTFEHVGFLPRVPEKLEGPFIIAGPALDDAVGKRLVDTHHGEYYGLRPGVVISVYIRKDLWDAFIERQSQ
ncbi:TIGR03663 family protein [Planctomycetales bacterium ZRK34]|nr:TIGR03663 family protein [Planctomycetales bacterium ZRK34]